mmetsp:Transcript_14739/g.29756  ORF Transcript_14739/g.29756 Transcript_14739/m.29756 type:complete len:87 (-) Transcript_14739:566-826(-)
MGFLAYPPRSCVRAAFEIHSFAHLLIPSHQIFLPSFFLPVRYKEKDLFQNNSVHHVTSLSPFCPSIAPATAEQDRKEATTGHKTKK